MDYPSEMIEKGLDEEGITDRYMAAAYGFGVAQAMAQEAIQMYGRYSAEGSGGGLQAADHG